MKQCSQASGTQTGSLVTTLMLQSQRAPSCLQEALQAPNPAFAMLEIGDLIPEKKKAEYEEAGGKL